MGIDFYLHRPQETKMLLSLKGSDVLVVWRPGSAHVWYLDTNKVADSLRIQWPKKIYFHIQISPDGRLLVTPSSEDLSLVIWDLSGRKVLWKLPLGRNETRMALFSPESIFLVTVDLDESIRIWDMRNGECFRVLASAEPSPQFCSSITVSPDLKYLISAHDDDAVCLWNINTGTCVTLSIAYTDVDQFSLFSPDGKTLAFKTLDCTIQLRDWERLLEEVPKATLAVEDVSFSSNSSMVATLFPGFEWVYEQSDGYIEVYFSPDSQTIATECSKPGCEIKIWVRGNSTFKLKNTVLSSPQSRDAQVMFARDSKLVAASLDTPNEIKVWDCDTGHLVLSLPFEKMVFILSLDVRPLTISSYSIIVSFDDHVEVWDLDACVCTLQKAIQQTEYWPIPSTVLRLQSGHYRDV
jgi:WD40 repeat protein